MRIRTIALAATLLSTLAGPGHSKGESLGHPANPMTDMLLLEGQCGPGMVLRGQPQASVSCKPLINTVYKNGRTGFYFSTQRELITFSGVAPQINHGPNTVTQPIDLILINTPGTASPNQPTTLTAKGDCTFSNPFRGLRTTLNCKATTSQGAFIATFVHDGSTPKILLENGTMQPD